VVTYRYAKRNNLPTERRATLREFFTSLGEALLALLTPVFVIGAIVTGFATPSEASVIAVVYSLVLGVVVYREIKIAELPGIFAASARTSSAVMVTVAAAQLFGWITTAGNVGPVVGQWLNGLSTNPYVILLVINAVLLMLGTIMETIPIVLVAVPILFPIVTHLGVDPVHFGVVLVLNLMIGTLLPPMGLNILMVSALSNAPVLRVAREAVGFIFILICVLLLITYVPILVLGLPKFVYGTQ
jgi:C4-dicarboxylate transporter DctM subunit